MNRKKRIEQEVEKTLQCFDSADRLDDNPFFYTRIKARLQNRGGQAKKSLLQVSWNILKPAFLVFIIAVNIFTAAIYFTSNRSQTDKQDQLLQAFAQEFSLDQSSYNPNLLINE